jgi:hypothetical protein
MRALALLCALSVLAGIATAVATTGADAAQRTPNASTASGAALVVQIGQFQEITWRWQRQMGKQRTPSSFSALRSPDPAYRRWVLKLWQARAHRAQVSASRWLAGRVRSYQASVDHWERVMGVRAGPLRQTSGIAGSLAARADLMSHWRKRAQSVERRAANPPYEAAWQCIHRYEGSWTDSGAPYYGGLQMDIGFQQHYGGYLLQTKGTADRWTPTEQMWVAARAFRSGRGFYPWPHTARVCGLI